MIISFQQAITTTGTAQNLPAYPVNRAITISAKSGNAAAIALGNSSSVSANSGFILAPGASVTVEMPGGNTNEFWALGTSGDIFSVIGQ